ncbi:MAG: polyisoprenyl-teichoic acid--peptidoglycan teichoic acid transferase [Actinomycetota bacterium]|nr:polyisoprenyl-teichoic acid--peptidoglycan teichoic acid transferase [Actinomycetota bacterium]
MTGRQLRIVRALLVSVIVLDLLVGTAGARLRGSGDVVVGQPPPRVRHALAGPSIVPAPSTTASTEGRAISRPIGNLPEPGSSPVMRQPDAQPYGPAIAFTSDVAVPDGLVFVLIAGSDARPGERIDRSRADAVHLLAVNPRAGTGTVLGFPRDSWVDIPGHGKGKLNTALALGGPDLLSETIQHLTGLPVNWWVLTSFGGLTAMVDALHGVVIHVDRRMSDRYSGAYFERGYHHLSGREVLAFSRDRHSVAQGDLSRSANQGSVVLSTLRKMRVEVGDMDGVGRWARVLWDHVRFSAPFDDVLRLGAIARRLDPDALANVVAPGEVGYAGNQSVVYLTEDAKRLFEDLRDDATIGSAPPPTTTTTTSTTTPATTTSITSTTLLGT